MASPSSHSPPSHKTSFNLFYYGLVVVASTAIVLAVYNIVVIGCCSQRRRQRQQFRWRTTNQSGGDTSRSFDNPNAQLIPTFKYRKEEMEGQVYYDNECAVCLSVFEDGEDVRQLPPCKHSFHAPCIDMWLYSHSDCPLCRATMAPLAPFNWEMTHQHLNPQQGLPDSGSLV